jgi:hypothetical protein
MTAQIAQRRMGPPWLVPAAFALIVAAAAVAVIVLSQNVGQDNVPALPSPFVYSPPATGLVRASVKQVGDGTLTIGEDAPQGAQAPPPRTVRPNASTVIEVLKPAGASDVQAGDWVTVIGISNAVRNFSIHAVVAVPNADSAGLSKGQFAGNEASPNPADRVILGGLFTNNGKAVTAGTAVAVSRSIALFGPSGPLTVDLTANPPLYRLTEATLADIHEGDRVAVRGPDDGPQAILVQPAGK